MRLLSGHIPSNKFTFMMRKVPSLIARDHELIDDVHHILVECIGSDGIRSGLSASGSFHVSLYC